MAVDVDADAVVEGIGSQPGESFGRVWLCGFAPVGAFGGVDAGETDVDLAGERGC